MSGHYYHWSWFPPFPPHLCVPQNIYQNETAMQGRIVREHWKNGKGSKAIRRPGGVETLFCPRKENYHRETLGGDH